MQFGHQEMLFARRAGWLPVGCWFIVSRWGPGSGLSASSVHVRAHTAPTLINNTAIYRHTSGLLHGAPTGSSPRPVQS